MQATRRPARPFAVRARRKGSGWEPDLDKETRETQRSNNKKAKGKKKTRGVEEAETWEAIRDDSQAKLPRAGESGSTAKR